MLGAYMCLYSAGLLLATCGALASVSARVLPLAAEAGGEAAAAVAAAAAMVVAAAAAAVVTAATVRLAPDVVARRKRGPPSGATRTLSRSLACAMWLHVVSIALLTALRHVELEGGQVSGWRWARPHVESLTFSFHVAFLLSIGSSAVAATGRPRSPGADDDVQGYSQAFAAGGGCACGSFLLEAVLAARHATATAHGAAVVLLLSAAGWGWAAVASWRLARERAPPGRVDAEGEGEGDPAAAAQRVGLLPSVERAERAERPLLTEPATTLWTLALGDTDESRRVRHRMEVLEPPFVKLRAKRALHAAVAHGLTFQLEATLLFWEVWCGLRSAASAGGGPGGSWRGGGASPLVGRELASAVAQTLGYGIHGAGISAFVLVLALHSHRAFNSGLRVVVAAAGLLGGLMAAAQAARLVADGLGEGAPAVVGMFASRAVTGLWLAVTYFRLGPGGGRAAKDETGAREERTVELPASRGESRSDPEAGEEEGARTATATASASASTADTDVDTQAGGLAWTHTARSPSVSESGSGGEGGSDIDAASRNALRDYGGAAVATTLALALVVSLDSARPSLGGALAPPSYPACTWPPRRYLRLHRATPPTRPSRPRTVHDTPRHTLADWSSS